MYLPEYCEKVACKTVSPSPVTPYAAPSRGTMRESLVDFWPGVASLPGCSSRKPRFSVSGGETIHRSCTYADVVVWLNLAPRCGIQRCTRVVPGTNIGIG